MQETYIKPTRAVGAALFSRDITGEVVMLNLLRFREIADYSASPKLAPSEPVSGHAAYQKYAALTAPILAEGGGEVMLLGVGGNCLIGPQDERWDLVLLVRYKSIADFMALTTNKAYLAITGHRTAALEDSRLLPIVETKRP